MPFKNLFRSSPKPKDGLAQSAREAIVDALHYCMYADRHIAIAEDEFIESVARKLDWDPNISYEVYEEKSTGAVTRALADKESRIDFLKTVRARLPGKTEREFALRLARDLVRVDGKETPPEAKAIGELETMLG